MIEINNIKSWCENPEDGAIKQAKNLEKLPFLFKHVALMPDTHQGYGMPIGGVIALKNVIIPNAVGVDIGCGMCAVRTSIQNIDKELLKKIMGECRKVIPVGFNRNKQIQKEYYEFQISLSDNFEATPPICSDEWETAGESLGTLGGGNHFIEFQKDNNEYLWVMIHSGSRNLGKKVADYYNKIAAELNAKWFSTVPQSYELAFLPVDSEQGKLYLEEMNYCVKYAFANRKLMINRILDIIGNNASIIHDEIINIAHNYAALENHFGHNVWVHRKGATRAYEGEIGIIPGSQGTKSYIVRGLGNIQSFKSCSHGAGRKMGRKEASRTLNLSDEIQKLDEQGIIHGIRTVNDLDEAAGAYKDINIVINEQKDLVEVITELTPLAVIKG